MKKFFKYLLIFIIIVILSIGGYYIYQKYFTEKTDAFKLVPADAVLIVETNDLTKAWNAISESKMWQHMISNPYFKTINENIQQVDKFLKNNTAANLLFSGKKLLASIHMVSGVDWDLLYTIDLETMSGISGILDKALEAVSGYRVQTRNYKNNDIIQFIKENDSKWVLNFCVIKNILLVSFNSVVIENAISQKDSKFWDTNKKFKQVINELSSKNLFKMYFNYSYLNAFAKAYITEENDVVTMLGSSLNFSAFNINLENEKLGFDGYTNIDSVGSYIRALAGVAPGKMRAYEILSDQTASYLSMNFDNYETFYKNLLQEYSKGNAKDMEDINKAINFIEKLLAVRIQDDFFNWFGNEIAFAKLRPKGNTRMEDFVVAIHANDIDNAKKGLTHFTNQIRKRSPLRFDLVNYKNYEINYLEMKGLFKIFFGKMFNKLEKPFFTFIEDYVVMSNSMDALKMIIDDYVIGKTLSHNKKFNDFRDNFPVKSTMTLFVQMPKIYSSLYFFSSEEKKAGMKKNKDLILSFSLIGLQLVTKGDMFKTTLIAAYDAEASDDDNLEKFETEVCDNLFAKEIDSLSYKIKLPAGALEKNGPYKEMYEDGKNVKSEGTISDNKINGLWRSFYESGNIKSAVKYKDGKADGIAYFYHDDTKGTKKAEVKFEEEKIVEKYQEYYENGAQKANIEYKEGKMHGEAKFFYENGKLKIEAEYKEGLKSGKWKYYDENGNLISKEKYKKGVKK